MATSELQRELYGSQRTLARDRAKRLLEEDHVQQNFQRGIEQNSNDQFFQTETEQSFRKHEVVPSNRSCWNPISQNATYLNLGSDTSPRTTVVRADFTPKPTPRFQQVIPEGVHDIHLADMVPKYMVDKSFGKSLYNSDFDGEKSYNQWSSRAASEGHKVGRRHKTTVYQKSTHFQLGSDPPELVTETSGCFTDKQPHSTSINPATDTGAGGGIDVSRSTSNVFRSGDYNFPSSMSRGNFITTQKRDYQVKETALPAGVTTSTKKAYSHVLPGRCASHRPGLSALRELLVEENSQVFQNPRDPTSTNVTRAFINYDKDRTGFITERSLRGVCRDLGITISDQEISQLMAECDQDKDGRISYVDFTKYLTGYNETESSNKEDKTTTNIRTYSQPQQSAAIEDNDSKKTEDQLYTGASYQDSTHFQFGDHHTPTTTIYTGDFSMDSVRDAKRERAVSPLSSKVMHEFPVVVPDFVGATTSRKDYVSHDVIALAKEKVQAMNTNKSRHEQLAVELSCEKDKSNQHYKTSVMTSSYVTPPPGTQREGPVNPTPKDYHHLESNRALLHPPPGPPHSENMTQFVSPLKSEAEARERMKEAQCERVSRIKDSKQTHIVLGSHSIPTLSEKMAEFGMKDPVDPNLPPAGKPNGPNQGYSVLSYECGLEDDGIPVAVEDSATKLQGVLQQRNFLKNLNPRDPMNINLRKAFLEYDKSLSGSINADDVHAVCREMQVNITEQELEKLMKKCDKNGDGQIDYHEFALHLSRKQHPSASLSSNRHRHIPPPSINSTTRHDFRDPATQRLTEIQQIVMEQDAKRYIPLHPTHFFHTDNKDDYLVSTTRKDFKPPVDLVPAHTS